MARKKQEIALQSEIETQEEWEEMLAKEGLHIIDIYQEWCGPCKAMLTNFRRLRNEIGDDLLHFCVAKADTVDCLDRYRGRCEPCFLFYAGGVLVEVIRGANCPKLMKEIAKQLTQEHKVLEGNAERKEIRDPLMAHLESQEKAALDEEESEKDEERKKEVTVAIIKPNVVAENKVDEIMEQMKEAGIEILEHQEKHLTEEEAREFYSHKKDEEYFDELVQFMSSGPSHVLVLTKGETGENIIQSWKDLLGPPNVEDAKDSAPESWRAKYGKEKHVNALHGSDSEETAMRELAFFFPNFAAPTIPGTGKKPKIQRTLALIRPDALKDKKDEILGKIEEAGFKVALQREVQLSKEMAEEFYKEHRGEEYFEELTTKMSSGPLLALALAREEAVEGWRDVLGPKEVDQAKQDKPESLRAQFSVEGDKINPLHGSDSPLSAKEELEFFFPMQQTVAVIKPDAYQTKDEIMSKIKEAGFNIAARKETKITQDIAQQFYGELQERDYFGDLVDHMTSGPTLFMVLSRENAVDGWRSLIGPTDPEQARNQDPQTLRAQFGKDIKCNAVHGSSNPEHASKNLKVIFGDMEFNKDGTVKGDKDEDEDEDEEDARSDGEQERRLEDREGTEEETREAEQEEDSEQKTGDEQQADDEQGEREKTDVSQRAESADGKKTENPAPSSPQPEQKSDSPQPEQKSESPQPEQKSESPQPEQKSESPQPEQKSESPQPEQKSESPQPEQKSESPQPEQKSESPQPEQKSESPQPEQKSESPQPEQKSESPQPEQKSESPQPEQKPGSPEETTKGDKEEEEKAGDEQSKDAEPETEQKPGDGESKGEESGESQEKPTEETKEEEKKKEDDGENKEPEKSKSDASGTEAAAT